MRFPPVRFGALCRTLAMLGVAVATPFVLAQAQEWKIGTVVAPPSMLGIIVDEGAAAIGTATGGRVTATRHQIANEQEITQNLIRGRIEMGYISATGLSVAIPEMGVLNTPYLWTSEKERDYVSDKYVAPYSERILAGKGLVLVKYGDAGLDQPVLQDGVYHPRQDEGHEIPRIRRLPVRRCSPNNSEPTDPACRWPTSILRYSRVS